MVGWFVEVSWLSVSLSLSAFRVAPTLEHRASVKRFVSLQFLNLRRYEFLDV
jgi:hypothetical protein